LAPDVAERFVKRVPSVSIRQGYGLTETAALISSNPVGREKPGSVGLPVPGTEVSILNDADQELPPGEVGEICARSPGVMQGYWRSPDVTAEALRDGWLHTGDLGYVDEEGYLFVVDRKKDLIITGGFNVYPAEIERVVAAHPAVAMVAVGPVADEVRGELARAYVVLRPGTTATEAEIIEHCRPHLAAYKLPRSVRFVPDLPKTSTGKIMRRDLKTLDPG
jgi:long-chain acyl-CoA synthetase